LLEEITREVEKREKEIVELLQELIRIPSVSGREGDVAAAIAKKMRSVGFDVVKIGNNKGAGRQKPSL
jgi:acetylornithine deacetylase/succinyl-diaminopimelate desuccinylase-like protein